MSQDEGYPSYTRRRAEALRADLLRGYRAAFANIYGEGLSEDGTIFTSSNTEIAPLTVESLERTAQEIKREVEASRQVHHQEAIALLLREAREFYAARPMHLLVSSRDDSMIDGLAHACQMISDCARLVSKPGAFGIADIERMDLPLTSSDSWFIRKSIGRGRFSPEQVNAYYDGVKAAAREARIMRNSGDGVCLPIAITTWKRIHQEDALAQAIERTQLPHEMTIHERIMPYRVKG